MHAEPRNLCIVLTITCGNTRKQAHCCMVVSSRSAALTTSAPAQGADTVRIAETRKSTMLMNKQSLCGCLLALCSGYDFGYLLKVLTSCALPGQEKEFFSLLKLYFPRLYDIKYLMASQDGFHGGLNKLGDDLSVSKGQHYTCHRCC